jgi:hypothetical protein
VDLRDDLGTVRRLEPTPEFEAWRDEVMAKVADGSIWREVAKQPSVEELVDEWRRSRAD